MALLLGLAAGLFALLAPTALRADLMSPFMALWSGTPNDELIGKIIWYGVPAAAVLGGVLATVLPGFAVAPLAAAALGWVAIGLALPDQFDYRLMAPAAASGLAAVFALVAAELAVRRRRMQRRKRRSLADMGDGVDEIEREAALRMDPVAIPREQVAPPRRAVPLNLDDVTVAERPAGPPPRWQDLDAEREPSRPRADIWGEAIRPEREKPAEVEQVIDMEPEPEPQPSPAQRGFRWDRADAPIGQRFQSGSAPGPRIVEVQRAPPAPVPRPQPAPPPERPRPAEAVRPAAVSASSWPEPEVERSRWTPPEVASEPRRGGGLVAALLAAVLVLLLGTIAAGGYFAYREGWVDQLVALMTPAPDTGTMPDPQAVAATTPAPLPEPAKQGLVLPPEPELASTATEAAATEATSASAPTTLPAKPPAASAQALAGPVYTDPFAYCSSVGTVDYVDERYRGPLVIPAITRALSVPDNASRDRVHWRCAGGAVVACASYIGPVCDLAPTVDEMRGYCARYPSAPQLMAPGGAWSCVNGQPQLPENAVWPVDGRGFRADSWVVVKATAAPAG